jgi:hypothetical protein
LEDREEPHMEKYKEIKYDWIYGATCALTSLPVSVLKKLK